MYDIITFGSATRDVFLISQEFRPVRDKKFLLDKGLHLPLGAKLNVDKIIFETGGGGTNTAVTFSRLGFKTAFVGKVGLDIRGRAVLEQLKQERVITSLTHCHSREPTGYSVILHSTSGERVILVHRGASSNFKVSEVPWPKVKARWFYVTSLAGRQQYLKKILKTARERKIKVAINPGEKELAWGYEKFIRILRDVDILILNKEEACRLTGCAFDNNQRILQRICFRLPGLVVVTDGPRGSFACDDKQHYFMGTHHVKPIDTLGAGDAFGSGFLTGFIKYKGDTKKALQLGTANAESVIRQIGAKAGILYKLPKGLKSVKIVAKRTKF